MYTSLNFILNIDFARCLSFPRIDGLTGLTGKITDIAKVIIVKGKEGVQKRCPRPELTTTYLCLLFRWSVLVKYILKCIFI